MSVFQGVPLDHTGWCLFVVLNGPIRPDERFHRGDCNRGLGSCGEVECNRRPLEASVHDHLHDPALAHARDTGRAGDSRKAEEWEAKLRNAEESRQD